MKGISAQDLANKLGVTRQAVATLLSSDLRVSKLHEVADALGVPVLYLLENPATETQDFEHILDSLDIVCSNCGTSMELTIKP